MPVTADEYALMINKVYLQKSSHFSFKEHLQTLPDKLANSFMKLPRFLTPSCSVLLT